MARYFLPALLVAVAAAAQNENLPISDQSQDDAAVFYKALNLNEQQIKAAKLGENQTAELFAYIKALGGNQEHEPRCDGLLLVDPAKIKFTFYSMPSYQITWTANESKKLLPYFDPKIPTQILFHDRGQNEKIWQPAELAFTYGVRDNKVNLITVDWSAYSHCHYAASVYFIVPDLSNIVSKMIQETLVANNEADYNLIRMTGLGHGAHAAGLTARKLPQQIPRITALDPAGHLYNIVSDDLKLKNNDAKFLDVIMTNRGSYGMNDLIGDINFLPSGGRIQKACENLRYGKNACSHQLALEYFVESVDEGVRGFLAKPAESWTEFIAQKSTTRYTEVMGESVSQKRFGNFYLDVNRKGPLYSKGIVGAYMVDQKSPRETLL